MNVTDGGAYTGTKGEQKLIRKQWPLFLFVNPGLISRRLPLAIQPLSFLFCFSNQQCLFVSKALFIIARNRTYRYFERTKKNKENKYKFSTLYYTRPPGMRSVTRSTQERVYEIDSTERHVSSTVECKFSTLRHTQWTTPRPWTPIVQKSCYGDMGEGGEGPILKSLLCPDTKRTGCLFFPSAAADASP